MIAPFNWLPFIVVVGIGLLPCPAEVRPARIFQSGMVLQQNSPIPVWGTAAPGEKVTVLFDGQIRRTVADPKGAWQTALDPVPAHSQGTTLIIAGDNQVIYEDVLVGEVWLASGQSNMEMTTGTMASGLGQTGRDIVSSAVYPRLRFCRINDAPSALPLTELSRSPRWIQCRPDTVVHFSAVAFIFARSLHSHLDVPIGIIDTSWGGKPIEPFIPTNQFQGHPVLEHELELAQRGLLAELKTMEGGVYARDASWLPGAIYHGRVHPIRPFSIRGVIWYQGESNSGHGEDPRHYRHKMRALIRGWRAAWERGDLPFYYVQLPGYAEAAPGWPFLREEQRLSMSKDLPHTGMAVTIDLDSPGIHPPNKVDVGNRLALWALANSYEKDIPYSGPLYDRFERNGNSMTLHFQHAESGLMTGRKINLRPVQETPEAAPTWFELRDESGVWHSADAIIRGETVEVSSGRVAQPTAARYAYHLEAKGCNLYNRDGLPASPFCTHPEYLSWGESSD